MPPVLRRTRLTLVDLEPCASALHRLPRHLKLVLYRLNFVAYGVPRVVGLEQEQLVGGSLPIGAFIVGGRVERDGGVQVGASSPNSTLEVSTVPRRR